MTVSELKKLRPSTFTGIYRIRRPFRCLSGNGSTYLACFIEDMSGSMKAFAWPQRYQGPMVFSDLDRVAVAGKICVLQHGIVIHLHRMEIVQNSGVSPVGLIPQSLCPIPHLLDKLQTTLASIGNPALKDFVSSVLEDDSIAYPFVALPASRSHHHRHAGGLLEHSLACASILSRFSELTPEMLDLGIVGALFHDIGKIRTVPAYGQKNTAGYVLNHDDLTLEVLATHLKKLDATCRDASTALRYIWSWRRNGSRGQIPLFPVAEVVALTDRISTGIDVHNQAFQNRPDWQQFARFTQNSLFWYPNLETDCDGHTDRAVSIGA